MRAARAFAWEFGRGHRMALGVLAAYVFGFWAIRVTIIGAGHPIRVAPPNGLAAFLVVPVTIAAMYFIGIFTFGLSGDLAARESIFPRRLFTLPVRTAALAGWPMVYGCAAMASLWLFVALIARVVGADVVLPWIWPMLFAAVVIAWMQALTWMPYGVRGLRIVLTVLWLATIDAVVFVAVDSGVADRTLVALLAPQLPLAYLAAWYGVARARRGEVPDWRLSAVRGARRPDAGILFRSSAHAQAWFEWRRHGRTLPSLVALVVPVELLLLFIPGNDTAPVVFLILFVALLTPPFLAAVAASALSTSTPYTVRRPLTSAQLIAAKIRMTVWSTIAAWMLVMALVPAALMLSGRLPILVERLQTGSEITGMLRMTAAVTATLVALVLSTWKHLVQSMCIGLTGRAWLIKGSVLVALIVLVAAWPLADQVLRNMRVQSIVWNALPWILVAMVFVKGIAGTWVAIRLHDSQLLSDRALVAGAVLWLGAVVVLYGMLVWFADSPAVPRYFLGAVAILSVPLARVAGAPLALEWSRHR